MHMLTMNRSVFVHRMSSQTSYSWANLPHDLLFSITENLDVTTTIRLSAVCTSWASKIHPCLPSFPSIRCDQPIPWLLCSARNSDTNPNCSVLTFYDLSTTAYFYVRIPIPSLYEHQWMGSYKSWLVTLDQQLQLHFIKPLTDTHVIVPCNDIRKRHPKKVIMCENPDNSNELHAYCLTQQGLLFSGKLEDKKWSWMADHGAGYEDITIHQEKVYTISRDTLCYWNLRSPYNKRTITNVFWTVNMTKYLLEWKGELVMLIIDKEEWVSLENQTEKRVLLCEIKFGPDGDVIWCRFVDTLEDDALFIGANCSYAVSSFDHENFIYFTN